MSARSWFSIKRTISGHLLVTHTVLGKPGGPEHLPPIGLRWAFFQVGTDGPGTYELALTILARHLAEAPAEILNNWKMGRPPGMAMQLAQAFADKFLFNHRLDLGEIFHLLGDVIDAWLKEQQAPKVESST